MFVGIQRIHPDKLAQVLVEMDEKINKKVEMGPRVDYPTCSSSSGPNYVSIQVKDPYLTALDDVEKKYKDSNYQRLYSVRLDALLDDLRKKHKE